MESTGEDRPKSLFSDFNPSKRAQLGLGAAALGSILLIFPFGTALAVIGVLLIVAGAATATSFERRSHAWWGLLMAGALLAAVSPLVAQAAETLGGFMAVIGATLILVAVVLALPVRGQDAP